MTRPTNPIHPSIHPSLPPSDDVMRGPMQRLARGVHIQPGMLPVMMRALDLESRACPCSWGWP